MKENGGKTGDNQKLLDFRGDLKKSDVGIVIINRTTEVNSYEIFLQVKCYYGNGNEDRQDVDTCSRPAGERN